MLIDFDTNRAYIVISSADEPIHFDLSVYRVSKINRVKDVFSTVNLYLSRLSKAEHNSLLDQYDRAKEAFNAHVLQMMDSQLMEILKNILDIVNVDRLRRFIEFDSGIIIPDKVKENYSGVSEMFERNKTYVRSEYLDLLTMSIALRFVLPIWSEYMSIVQDIVPEYTREMRAYGLLRQSVIANHKTFERLMIYIRDWVTPSLNSTSSTVSGIGREEIPEWLCSLVMVRRLPVIDVTNVEKSTNIINSLFGYVRESVTNLEKKFRERIKDKKPPSEAKTADRDPSFIETYRTKQEIPFGDLVAHDVFFSNIQRACKTIIPDMPDEIIIGVLKVTHELEHEELSSHNILLTQWICDEVVPAPLIHALEKRSAIGGMIISQCLCHYWGLHNLALLCTGINLSGITESAIESYTVIPDDVMERLDYYYPYKRIVHKTEQKAKQRITNPAVLTISELSVILSRHRKAVRVPPFLTIRDVAADRYGHMDVPRDIIKDLAILLVKINELNVT